MSHSLELCIPSFEVYESEEAQIERKILRRKAIEDYLTRGESATVLQDSGRFVINGPVLDYQASTGQHIMIVNMNFGTTFDQFVHLADLPMKNGRIDKLIWSEKPHRLVIRQIDSWLNARKKYTYEDDMIMETLYIAENFGTGVILTTQQESLPDPEDIPGDTYALNLLLQKFHTLPVIS